MAYCRWSTHGRVWYAYWLAQHITHPNQATLEIIPSGGAAVQVTFGELRKSGIDAAVQRITEAAGTTKDVETLRGAIAEFAQDVHTQYSKQRKMSDPPHREKL